MTDDARLWRDVWEEVGVELHGYLTPESERIARAVVRGLKRGAEHRAMAAFVTASNTVEKYHTDAQFHAAVDVVARTMVMGVFGELPLTAEEQAKRNRAMEQIISGLV